jgi:hypothetical protein
MSLCVKWKEWKRLVSRVHLANPAELEAISHYCSEPAAKGLAEWDPLAAAKVFRALGMRIVAAGKSKHYSEALNHFERARDLSCVNGRVSDWQELVQTVRAEHPRESGFLSALEEIASGESPLASTFAEQAQERWKQQTS